MRRGTITDDHKRTLAASKRTADGLRVYSGVGEWIEANAYIDAADAR